MDDREQKTENFKRGLMDLGRVNMPTYCEKCGGVMVFKGVGEYKCEDCGYLDYDDYGKARNYLEKHPGATTAEVSMETGVSQKALRDMLREKRLEIAPNSGIFLRCEICGADIRYGRFCSKCEAAYHREIEERARAGRNINLSGYGSEKSKSEDGAKRFTRER